MRVIRSGRSTDDFFRLACYCVPFVVVLLVGTAASSVAAVGASSRVRGAETGSGAGSTLDFVAERAYLRLSLDSDVEVGAPAVGQQVFFYFAWRVDGSGPVVEVSFRAILDSQVFCTGSVPIVGGNTVTTHCNAGWTATSGTHRLRWEIDYTNAIAEPDEDNNGASHTWGVGNGVSVDVTAVRALLRTMPSSGPESVEVTAPITGQEVYLHLQWSTTDLPSSVPVPLRATIDGVGHCSGELNAPGSLANAWCPSPWQATSGEHTLRWVLDGSDVIVESNESNNEAVLSFSVGVDATPTYTTTRSRTPTQTATQSQTVAPTHTLVGIPTPTPTRIVAAGSGFYGRGDADCSITHRAADVVATLRGLGTTSACGNDDCDRDGDMGADDVDCAAGCLFGQCPVPPNAPQVDGVAPDSATSVVGGSSIVVSGSNLNGASSLVRATIGGRTAGVVEADGNQLTIGMPLLESGTYDLVVYSGELASLPFQVTVEPPSPIGAPDDLEDLLNRLDLVIERFAALDLETIYVEEEVPLILDTLNDLRAEIQAFATGLQGLPPELGATIDKFTDASGIPEELEDAADLIDQFAGEAAGGGATGSTVVLTAVQKAAVKAAVFLGGSAQTAAIAAFAAPAAVAFAKLAGVVVVTAVIIDGAVKLGDDLSRPGGFRVLTFFDEDGNDSNLPTARGGVRIQTSALFPTATLDLSVTTMITRPTDERKGFELPALTCSTGEPNCAEFRFPDAPGMCGPIAFRLSRGPLLGKQIAVTQIQPDVLDVGPPTVDFDERLEMFVTGVWPCGADATFEGPAEGTQKLRISTQVEAVANDHNALHTAASLLIDGKKRELPPGMHEVGVRSDTDVNSARTDRVRFRTRITGVRLECEPPEIVIPPGAPQTTECRAVPLPEGVGCFPAETEIDFVPSDLSKAALALLPDEPEDPVTIESVAEIGETKISADVFSSDVFLGRDDLDLEVGDNTPPSSLTVFDNVGADMECGAVVQPSGSITLFIDAEDNHSIDYIRVTGPDTQLAVPLREAVCSVPDNVVRTCSEGLSFGFRSDAADGEGAFTIEAFDLSGNRRTIQCPYAVEGLPTEGYIFASVEVHEHTVTSCNVSPNALIPVTDYFDRRRGVFDGMAPFGLDNLLRFAERKSALAGAGWTSEQGRDCRIYTNVLTVTVEQEGGLTLDQANQRLLQSPTPMSTTIQVLGCEILNSCP